MGAGDDHGHDLHVGCSGETEGARLERRLDAEDRALGEHDGREACGDGLAAFPEQRPRSRQRILRIEQDLPGGPQRGADHGPVGDLGAGDESERRRQRGEQEDRVEHPLVEGHDDMGSGPIDCVDAVDVEIHVEPVDHGAAPPRGVGGESIG